MLETRTQDESLPAYDKVTPEHIVPGITAVLKWAHAEIDALEANVVPTVCGALVNAICSECSTREPAKWRMESTVRAPSGARAAPPRHDAKCVPHRHDCVRAVGGPGGAAGAHHRPPPARLGHRLAPQGGCATLVQPCGGGHIRRALPLHATFCVRRAQGVKDSEALRKAYETVQPENVKLGLRLSQSRCHLSHHQPCRVPEHRCSGSGSVRLRKLTAVEQRTRRRTLQAHLASAPNGAAM